MSKWYRSSRDKKVTGLCGGLAEMMNVDVTLLRLLVVVTSFFSGGTVLLLYFIASLVIPKEPTFHPPYDPYGAPYGRPGYTDGWNGANGRPYPQQGSTHAAPGSYGSSYESAKSGHNIDEMMKDIEKKAMQRELEQLRAKVAQLEKNQNNDKGEV